MRNVVAGTRTLCDITDFADFADRTDIADITRNTQHATDARCTSAYHGARFARTTIRHQ